MDVVDSSGMRELSKQTVDGCGDRAARNPALQSQRMQSRGHRP